MAGESLRIKGDIIANEALSFNGQIEGTISVPEHTLVVGPQARVEADVRAKAIVVAGTLHGNVSARERFELQEQGTLEGTLEAPRIQIREGALLRVKVTMPAKPAGAAPAAPKDAPAHLAADANLSLA
jgi:cytoskeletal protein CcmA (bactofilin family)